MNEPRPITPKQHPIDGPGAGRAVRGGAMRSAACCAVVLCGLAGCNKPLFPEGTPRTPFEMHDRMRDRSRPMTEPDVFGRPQPALRARLGQQN